MLVVAVFFCLIFLPGSFSRWHSSSCSNPEKKSCADGLQCVAKLFLCDGQVDCEDGSDEWDCPHDRSARAVTIFPGVVHPRDLFNCSDGEHRILPGFACDGDRDCRDGSDEWGCSNGTTSRPTTSTVPPTTGKRRNGTRKGRKRTISTPLTTSVTTTPSTTVTTTTSSTTTTTVAKTTTKGITRVITPKRPATCNSKQFRCSDSRECIDRILLCDGYHDCTDGSDEGMLCDKCQTLKNYCEDICINEPSGPRCECRRGTVLAGDGRSCTDVDECAEGSHNCDHLCVNERGGYTCLCASGFQLDSDRKTCYLPRPEGHLFFSIGAEILLMPLFSNESSSGAQRQKSYSSLVETRHGRILGIDYSIKGSRMFFVDYDGEFINEFTSDSRCLVEGLRHPQNIATDWITGQIYFANDKPGVIGVCSPDGRFCRTLIRDVSRPRGLAVHPKRGMLFWSDWGDDAKIERSGLDGSNRSAIVVDDVVWPNSLSVDYIRDQLYWIDAKLKSIQRCDLDGNNREIVLNTGLEHPYDLVVFDKRVYWTDWGLKSVFAYDFVQRKRETFYSSTTVFPFGIAIMSIYYQDRNVTDHCGQLNCTHLCGMRFDEGPQCLCPDKYSYDNLYNECFPDPNPQPIDPLNPLYQPRLCTSLFDDNKDFCENGGGPNPHKPNTSVTCSCPPDFFGVYCELSWTQMNDKLFDDSSVSPGSIAGRWIAGVLVFVSIVLILLGLALYHRRTAYYNIFIRYKSSIFAPSVMFRKRMSSVSVCQDEKSSLTRNESGNRLQTTTECGFANPVYDDVSSEERTSRSFPFRSGSKADLNSVESDTDSALDCTTASVSTAGSNSPTEKRY